MDKTVLKIEHESDDYWTMDMLKSALPLPIPILDPGDREKMTGLKAPYKPEPGIEQLRTTRVGDTTQNPFKFVGKLFMTFNGQRYQGSAWVYANRAIASAGHCIYDKDNGGAASNVIFIPRYDDGAAPIGQWRVTDAVIYNGWKDNRYFEYDMSGLIVDRPIAAACGGQLDFEITPQDSPYRSSGYPAESIAGYGFDGKHMWTSTGSNLAGGNFRKMENNMTGGCSGGPWTILPREPGSFASNGLNSFRYQDEPNVMYSPVCDAKFKSIHDDVKNS